MGLDITAYSKLEYLETMETEAWEGKYRWPKERGESSLTIIAHHWEPVYADRAAPIIEGGVYKVNGEAYNFRAGSYSGYNEWRGDLSQLMLGVSARTVWGREEEFKDKPFYELINFSDCEGIIGPVVARKLAADFAAHQTKTDAYYDWWRRKYADWRKAFELAADGGLVEFH
jgi:hypothetical protein